MRLHRCLIVVLAVENISLSNAEGTPSGSFVQPPLGRVIKPHNTDIPIDLEHRELFDTPPPPTPAGSPVVTHGKSLSLKSLFPSVAKTSHNLTPAQVMYHTRVYSVGHRWLGNGLEEIPASNPCASVLHRFTFPLEEYLSFTPRKSSQPLSAACDLDSVFTLWGHSLVPAYGLLVLVSFSRVNRGLSFSRSTTPTPRTQELIDSVTNPPWGGSWPSSIKWGTGAWLEDVQLIQTVYHMQAAGIDVHYSEWVLQKKAVREIIRFFYLLPPLFREKDQNGFGPEWAAFIEWVLNAATSSPLTMNTGTLQDTPKDQSGTPLFSSPIQGLERVCPTHLVAERYAARAQVDKDERDKAYMYLHLLRVAQQANGGDGGGEGEVGKGEILKYVPEDYCYYQEGVVHIVKYLASLAGSASREDVVALACGVGLVDQFQLYEAYGRTEESVAGSKGIVRGILENVVRTNAAVPASLFNTLAENTQTLLTHPGH